MLTGSQAADALDLVGPGAVWDAWSFEPTTTVLLIALAALYARAVYAAGRHMERHTPAPMRIAAFAGGWLALAIALVSPLDPLGETLFAAHMVQHLTLIAVAAPLMVLGAPPPVWLWVLPIRGRRAVALAWNRSPALRRAVSWAMTPAVVVAVHTIALWFWHFPRPYQAALLNPFIHILEHTSFLGTAVLFWWVVLHPTGRRTLGFGAAILAVAFTLCQSGALGALLMFSSRAWYPVHAAGERLWGMTPLGDQQLAGLIMWIPAGSVYVGAAAALFMKWMRSDERAVRASERMTLVVS